MAGTLPNPEGYWILLDKLGNETTYYTKCYAKTYIHKATNTKYSRGRMHVFFPKKGENLMPPLIEESDEFTFVYAKAKRQAKPLSTLDEIYINELLKSIFKK